MFTLGELEDDPSLLLDLKEDVREECATLGDVTNVVLYDVRVTPILLVLTTLVCRSPFPIFVLSVARTRGYHDCQVP